MNKSYLSQQLDALASSCKWKSGHLNQTGKCPFPFLLTFNLERFLPSFSLHFEARFSYISLNSFLLILFGQTDRKRIREIQSKFIKNIGKEQEVSIYLDTSIYTNAINNARTSSMIDIFWRKIRKGVIQTFICLSIALMTAFQKHRICTKLLHNVKKIVINLTVYVIIQIKVSFRNIVISYIVPFSNVFFAHTTHYCSNCDYYKGAVVEPQRHCTSLQEVCNYSA